MTSVEYCVRSLVLAAAPSLADSVGLAQSDATAAERESVSLGVNSTPMDSGPLPMISEKPPWSGAIMALLYLAASRMVIGNPSYHLLAITKNFAFS